MHVEMPTGSASMVGLLITTRATFIGRFKLNTIIQMYMDVDNQGGLVVAKFNFYLFG